MTSLFISLVIIIFAYTAFPLNTKMLIPLGQYGNGTSIIKANHSPFSKYHSTLKPCPKCSSCPQCRTRLPTEMRQISSPAPTPIPRHVHEPTHSALKTVDLGCSMYGMGKRAEASSLQLDYANKVRANCQIVLTWWELTPSLTWCPYIMQNSIVKYCGPYDDYDYIMTTNNPDDYDLGGDMYNKFILPLHPEWIYPGSKNMWNQNSGQTAYNRGNLESVDFYMDYFIKGIPSMVYNGRWKGNAANRKWNLRFLDDYFVDGSRFIIGGPFKSRYQWDSEALTAMRRLRKRADEEGRIALFANIWSDVDTDYFRRPIYRQLMDYLDYTLFETWTYKIDGKTPETETVWLRRIKIAQDLVKNRRAQPVVNTELGDYWYALSSLLLIRENGRGVAWSQRLPPDNVLEKVRSLDLGAPLEDFRKRGGVYQREWTRGKVVVNPSDSISYFVSLNGIYTDLETGKTVQGVTLPPKTGKIFLNQRYETWGNIVLPR